MVTNEQQSKFDRILKKLMPGEAQAIAAMIYSKSVVESAAERRMGYKPDVGYRPMTAQERIKEFDNFTIEQKNSIIEKKGMQWYLAYAEEIDNLKQVLRASGGNI